MVVRKIEIRIVGGIYIGGIGAGVGKGRGMGRRVVIVGLLRTPCSIGGGRY